MLGFAASVAARLALGGAAVAAAGLMVWAIERPRPAAAAGTAAAPPPPAAVGKPLRIEASYRVATWTVQVLGRDCPPDHSDGTAWTGRLALAPRDEVLIRAAAAPGQEALAHRALRIRLGAQGERIVWGGGDVTTTVEAQE